jgi:hypothetical protein
MAVALVKLLAPTSAPYPIAVLFEPVELEISALTPLAVL